MASIIRTIHPCYNRFEDMKDKTIITFHSGLDTIGGVIMEVRYNDDRAFFEAGTAYDPAFDIFDGIVNRRKDHISDLLWINEIPMIDGVYRKQDIDERFPFLLPADGYAIHEQAFFISHLHLDHMRMMGLISPEVKVYLSKPAQILEKALEDVGQGVENIHSSYTDMTDDMEVGEIRVHRFILNDDSYQDYSFYIETPDLKIHYTGDVFVYGKYRDKILKEIDWLNKARPDILVCEGTRFPKGMDPNKRITPSFEPKDGLITYDRLKERMSETIAKHKGLILFNYYEREMSDVLLFEELAKRNDRILVYEPESAHLINSFFNRSVSMLVPDTYDNKPEYLEEILSRNIVLDKEEILSHPQRYMVQNSYPNLMELLDYKNCDPLYMHHSGIPLGDFDPKMANLKNMIDLCHMQYTKTYEGGDGYFSPHAEHYQILSYIEKVNAKLVIPCHTLNRKAMIANLKQPYFYALEKVSYIYDEENNTLEALHE